MCEWGTDIEITTSEEKKVLVDACIAPLIQLLNMYGVLTLSSCCGHGKEKAEILISQNNIKTDEFGQVWLIFGGKRWVV